MGSRSPEGGHRAPNDSPQTSVSNSGGGEPRGSHNARDGDGCVGNGGSDDDDDDDDDRHRPQVTEFLHDATSAVATTTNKAKKKRKPRKKKKASKSDKSLTAALRPFDPIERAFPSGRFPIGERVDYDSPVQTRSRNALVELSKAPQRYWEDHTFLNNYRKAAEIHREARQWAQGVMQPGASVQEIVFGIEDRVRTLLSNSGLDSGACRESGLGFPTGLCINNQVAHYTPNPGQPDVFLQDHDVVTIDFGVHINGWIVDSAFTVAFDPTYDPLLTAVKAATNAGIKTAGIDVRISDVSAAIQEVMESYEVEIGGRTYPVKPVRNITGHNIKQNQIHGGKSIPFVRNSDQTKMEEGEVFAIETFGSTGKGLVVDDIGVYGYGLDVDEPLSVPTSMASARRLHKTIRENFGTIVFCRRYLERLGCERYLAGMNSLVTNGVVEQYRPLMDIKGSYSAQFEHTLILHETHKEVLSRGDDY